MYTKKIRYGDSAWAGTRLAVGPLSSLTGALAPVAPPGYVPDRDCQFDKQRLKSSPVLCDMACSSDKIITPSTNITMRI